MIFKIVKAVPDGVHEPCHCEGAFSQYSYENDVVNWYMEIDSMEEMEKFMEMNAPFSVWAKRGSIHTIELQ